jgi:hypothetical protein
MYPAVPPGGMLFSVGTTDWPLALSNALVSQITENVIERLVCRPLLIHGPVCAEGEYVGEGEMVGAGQQAGWYVDGDQSATAGLTGVQWGVTAGRAYFGSRTVRVAGTEEYLRRRVIRMLDALA